MKKMFVNVVCGKEKREKNTQFILKIVSLIYVLCDEL